MLRCVRTGVGCVRKGAIVSLNENGGKCWSETVVAKAAACAAVVPSPKITINGEVIPCPRPLSDRILDALDSGDQTSTDIIQLMQNEHLDWRVLRCLAELFIGNGYAKNKKVLSKVELIKQTAGSWDVLREQAVHHRFQGHPPQEPPSLAEAQSSMRCLVKSWFEEHAPE